LSDYEIPGFERERSDGLKRRNICNLSRIEIITPTLILGYRGGFETTSNLLLTHLFLFCKEKPLLGDRPAAGLRTLTPSTKVRILVSQPLKHIGPWHFGVMGLFLSPVPLRSLSEKPIAHMGFCASTSTPVVAGLSRPRLKDLFPVASVVVRIPQSPQCVPLSRAHQLDSGTNKK
jgi:hypothetical protein